jgi:hypothetical protein
MHKSEPLCMLIIDMFFLSFFSLSKQLAYNNRNEVHSLPKNWMYAEP